MSTQTMTSAAVATGEGPLEFDRRAQIKSVLIGLSFLWLFLPVLRYLLHYWLNTQDWSHGPIIPLFSIYLVHLKWAQVREAPVRHTWVGLVLMLGGIAAYQYFMWVAQFFYLQSLSMLVTLTGVVVFLCGLPILRHVWVPLAFLLFAIPLPKDYYFALTDPLRRMAAIVATSLLTLFPNLQIETVGSVIEYYYNGQGGRLGVEDACSGMRGTMALCAVGVAVTFLSDRPWWQRAIMLGSCVPIAVFANFIRVTTTCILYIYAGEKYAQGTYHTVLGLVTLLMAFAIFSGLGWLLGHLVVEEPDSGGEPAATG
jgi:exosortase